MPAGTTAGLVITAPRGTTPISTTSRVQAESRAMSDEKKQATAYSPDTGTRYDSWDDLVAAEANGWAVVIMMRETSLKSGRARYYSRAVGPFAVKRLAQNKASSLRARWRRETRERLLPSNRELLSVNVEPLWNEI
jgi:hypothetical protein